MTEQWFGQIFFPKKKKKKKGPQQLSQAWQLPRKQGTTQPKQASTEQYKRIDWRIREFLRIDVKILYISTISGTISSKFEKCFEGNDWDKLWGNIRYKRIGFDFTSHIQGSP
jgi:hypothetical protein